MEQNYQILLLVIGIAFVLYAFLTLQFLLGIVTAVIIIIAILIIPSVKRWIETH